MNPALRRLDDPRGLARGRIGLLIGPGATLADPKGYREMCDRAAAALSVSTSSRHLEIGTRAIASGIPADEVRRRFVEALALQQPAPALTPLAKVMWSSILSLTPDDALESALQADPQWRAARRDVTIVADTNSYPRERTTPIFKLLGSASYGNMLVSNAEYLLAKARWERPVRAFLDTLRTAPILVVGLSPVDWMLDDLFSYLFAHQGQRPTALVFLESEAATASQMLMEVAPSGTLYLASESMTSVAKDLAPSARNQQISLTYAGAKTVRTADLSRFSDLIVHVNGRVESGVDVVEKERLLDYLFAPDLPNWDAFVHGMDFVRSITAEVEHELLRYQTQVQSDAVFEVCGTAASGKTTLLKRIALNVAKAGAHVLWARDYRFSDSISRFSELFKTIGTSSPKAPLYLFVDSAAGTREVSIVRLIEKARAADIRLVVVASLRLSEDLGSDTPKSLVRTRWTLDDALDESEWVRLPDYLVQLGVHLDRPAAVRAVATAESARRTRDTLAILYFLLPKSRQPIKQSIVGEYLSLGNSQHLREILRARLDAAPDVLKRAYALVAVSDHHGVPLPIEVLVLALGVGYGAWLSLVSDQVGPAFGLLYADSETGDDSSFYRTRNSVVTDIVVDAINGGALTRYAEAAALEDLLRACSGTNPVYARYATDLLTPWKDLKPHFDFPTGLRLYDAALTALPFSHRTILHHKGIWQRKMGNRPSDAVETLDAALAADKHLPHGESTDAEEHIRTSKAAAILDQVRLNQVDRARGRREALRELERARSSTFLNPNAVHVYARLISKMIGQDPGIPASDKLVAANQAVAEVDRTLLLMRSSRLKRWVADYDPTPLHECRDELMLSWVNDPALLEEQARDAWNRHDVQEGFALAVRRRLGSAHASKDQGSRFKAAFDYWQECVTLVRQRAKVGPELAEVGATLYYGWQIRQRSRELNVAKAARSPLEWGMLEEMTRITLGSSRYQDDLFYRYLYGLALGHLGKWPECKATFAENRRSNLGGDFLQAPQDYLLDDVGLAKRLQGRLKRAVGVYFLSDVLRVDFMAAARDPWPAGNQIVHAQLVFSFAGPLATLDEKACGIDLAD